MMKAFVRNPRNIFEIVFETFFFLFFFIYLYKFVNPELAYHIQQPVFFIDIDIFWSNFKYPGSVIQYLSGFFSQFFIYRFTGSLIITLTAFAIHISVWGFLKKIKDFPFSYTVSLIPAICVLAAHGNYKHMFSLTFIFLISVFLLWLWAKTAPKLPFFLRMVLFALLHFSLFYLAGGVASMLFALGVVFCEIFNHGERIRFVNILLYIALSVVWPFLFGLYSAFLTVEDAFFNYFLHQIYYHPSVFVYALYAFVPLALLVYGGLKFIGFRANKRKRKGWELVGVLPYAVESFVLVVLTIVFLLFSKDPTQHLLANIDYLAYKKDWKGVLNEAKKNSTNNRLVDFQLIRALYHSGTLGSHLFEYPNLWAEKALFFDEVMTRKILMPHSDVYFDMGFINESQHWAYEAQTIYENSPRILKRLAMTNLINENYQTADKFLELLKKSIIHRAWANKHQAYVKNPTLSESNEIIAEKRKLMPKTDFFSNSEVPISNIMRLLMQNGENKMAFEYMMAYRIFRNELNHIVKNAEQFTKFGYAKIPKIYQEAILIYLALTDDKPTELKGVTFDPKIKQSFINISKAIYQYKDNPQMAKDMLKRQYGNTYLYYSRFGNRKAQQQK